MKRLLAALLLLTSTAHAADLRELPFFGNYYLLNEGGTVGVNNFALNSNDDAVAWLYQMPRADTLTTVCWRLGAETGNIGTMRLSIQTPSATTFGPNGTVLGGGSPASVTFDPSSVTDATANCQTLANSIAVTRGQKIAVVFDYSSGTIDGSNNITVTTSVNNIMGRQVWPVAITKTNGGAWARVSGMPVFWVKSGTTTYGYPVETVVSSGSVSSDSTPDEYGNSFTLSSDLCDTAVISGVTCFFESLPAANKTLKFSLYSSTTRLRSVDLDSDEMGISADSARTVSVLFNTADTGALTDTQDCGTEYIIAVAPQATGTNVVFNSYEADAAAELDAWIGGQDMSAVTRTDSGAWTSSETDRVLLCNPIISAITTGAGGGGLLNPNQVSGGSQ